jgi:hypothetical protein
MMLALIGVIIEGSDASLKAGFLKRCCEKALLGSSFQVDSELLQTNSVAVRLITVCATKDAHEKG